MTILQSSENRQALHAKDNEESKAHTINSIKDPTPAEKVSENLPITAAAETTTSTTTRADFVRAGLKEEIAKQVIRKKLAKLRHLVLEKAISSEYLDSLFPRLLQLFRPQPVVYNGGIGNVKNWKISCYLEVMDGGVPTTDPNLELLDLFQPLLDQCNDLFLYWFRQKNACNKGNDTNSKILGCSRLMTFITRYTPAPGEQALLKVCLAPLSDKSWLRASYLMKDGWLWFHIPQTILFFLFGSMWMGPEKLMERPLWLYRLINGLHLKVSTALLVMVGWVIQEV